jgi:hypothetical protein
MKIFSYGKDGGNESTVWGYWLVEIKSLFSVALLCFEDGSREAYHSHAFNCISWVLKGQLNENHLKGGNNIHKAGMKPVLTYKNTFHKVSSTGRTWVLTFRGPWNRTWKEYLPKTDEIVTLTNGRKVI